MNARAVQTLRRIQNVCVETQLSAAGIQQVRAAGSRISDELPGDAAAVVHRDTLWE